MKIDQLTHKVDQLVSHVQPVQVEKQTIPFDMALFSPDEQLQLQALLVEVEPKYRWIEGHLILDQLSMDDLDKLSRWENLQQERRTCK